MNKQQISEGRCNTKAMVQRERNKQTFDCPHRNQEEGKPEIEVWRDGERREVVMRYVLRCSMMKHLEKPKGSEDGKSHAERGASHTAGVGAAVAVGAGAAYTAGAGATYSTTSAGAVCTASFGTQVFYVYRCHGRRWCGK